MRIDELGNPHGPPLVLLHGLASSPRCWERILPHLEARHRILLADLRTRTADRFSLEGVAQRLDEELAGRVDGRVAVVGHSMGGLVALHLAARSADRLSCLVLADVPAIPVRRRLMGQMGAVARSSVRRRGTAIGLVLTSLLSTSPLQIIAATQATLRADLELQAAAANLPTLVLWGAEDRIVPVEVGERLAAAMPSARLQLITDSGHQPMWEAAEEFALALEAFLGSVRA